MDSLGDARVPCAHDGHLFRLSLLVSLSPSSFSQTLHEHFGSFHKCPFMSLVLPFENHLCLNVRKDSL